MNKLLWFACGLAAIFFLSCSNSGNTNVAKSRHQTGIKYAQGFDIEYFENYKKVSVNRLFKGSSEVKEYYLVSNGINTIPNDAMKIKIPVSRVVCSSTTHLPSLVLIDEVNALAGFPSLKYISSPRILERVKKGEVKELGSENGMNIEGIIDLSPDLMIGYLMAGDSRSYDKIESSGIPVVINSDYLENTPLGRAEWIKFIAAFFNKEALADSLFTVIENKYLAIRNLTMEIAQKPDVFSGVLYGGTWFMPGGKSFAGIFLEDAGGNFLWSDNEETGSLELSFETVLDRAQQADFWISASNFMSKSDLTQSDERYQLFKAYQEDHIYTYTLKVTENGGNDFFETGYARPDWVLSDMVKILHPELLPNEEFHFFQKLE